MGLPRRDANLHTYGDYLGWPEDVRYELIDGVAYLMSPAPSRVHQELVGELYRQIANALEATPSRAYVAPFDVRLPKSGEPDASVDTVVQPDVLVVCDPEKLDERGMRGAPDWVIEVLSPATAGHDQTVKARGVRAGRGPRGLAGPSDRPGRDGVRARWRRVRPADHLGDAGRDGAAGPAVGDDRVGSCAVVPGGVTLLVLRPRA